MGAVVYSLYDALVSINVPDEKSKAVIDAMEREMMDKLATKADLVHVSEALSKDIKAVEAATTAEFAHFRELLSKDIQAVNTRIDHQLNQLTVRFVGTAGLLAAAVALLERLL
jgi:hypothetical protein